MISNSVIPQNVEIVSPDLRVWQATGATIVATEADSVTVEYTISLPWQVSDSGSWILRSSNAPWWMPIGNNGIAALTRSLISPFDVSILPSMANLNPGEGYPKETLIAEAVILDAQVNPDVTWEVADANASNVVSTLFHVKRDGTRVNRGGAGGIPGGSGNVFTGNLSGAWEPDTLLVTMELETVLTYPDGSTKTTITRFYKWVEPSAPFASSLDIWTAPPIFESDDVSVSAFTDHLKAIDKATLIIGLQEWPLTGGNQPLTINIQAGTHNAIVEAYYVDGTESLSPVKTITVQGGVNPATTAQLEQAVANEVYQSMLGNQHQTLTRIDNIVGPAWQTAIDSQEWYRIGQARADAYFDEMVRWQAILDNPDTSPELRAVADSGVQGLQVMREFAQSEADAFGFDTGLANYRAEQNAIMALQYMQWVRSADPMTTPFILDIPGK